MICSFHFSSLGITNVQVFFFVVAFLAGAACNETGSALHQTGAR